MKRWAAGLPVVAPAWDGYRDIVEDGQTGFLVHTAVCPDSGFLNSISMLIDPAHVLGQRVIIDMQQMMECLRVLSENRERAKRMGIRGRERVKSLYSWRSVIARYEELWDKLIRKGRSVHRPNTMPAFGFMDYDKVFAAHPETTVAMNTVVRFGDEAEALLRLLESHQLFSPSPVAGFSDALDMQILDALRAESETTLENLVEKVTGPQSGRSMAMAQISRLAKYGVLSLSIAHNEQPHREESRHAVNTDPTLRPIGV